MFSNITERIRIRRHKLRERYHRFLLDAAFFVIVTGLTEPTIAAFKNEKSITLVL